MNVGRAAAQSGWSPRMLRYVERIGLVVPARTGSGYRRYGLREVNRLRREATLREAVDSWLAGTELGALEWEQRKHERLLAA